MLEAEERGMGEGGFILFAKAVKPFNDAITTIYVYSKKGRDLIDYWVLWIPPWLGRYYHAIPR